MAKNKITVVGAGNVGATSAFIATMRRLGEIVLIDIVKGLAEGKALDMAQASPIELSQQDIVGTTDWAATAGSDVVIVTSGIPRKPGMSRDDLLATNAGIVRDVCRKVAEQSPNAIVIVVCNPLDAMVHVAAKVTGFVKHRVMGMAGALDSARFSYFLAAELAPGRPASPAREARSDHRPHPQGRHRDRQSARLQRLLRPGRRRGQDGGSRPPGHQEHHL
jgi:malate dehydrogenase